jgi:hypothetical protein
VAHRRAPAGSEFRQEQKQEDEVDIIKGGKDVKLKPLKQWICDSCGEIIKKPENGWFEWYINDNTNIEEGFRIVHHQKACMYAAKSLRKQNKLVADLNLTDVIGPNGLADSLFRIELSEKGVYKIKDLREFVEILRRLHVPYWEEARRYWDKAHKDGFHDACDYGENALLSILNEYAEHD